MIKMNLQHLMAFNQVVCGDFNKENLELERLMLIDTGATYTWKKSENT